ncbi:hypothetical protein J5X84_19795 [Streptosporangiaceae bacterium NEAU-GS5]|nr:hypothetical protein [Streptosporangiaceae bacterium NEAU-GS5]
MPGPLPQRPVRQPPGESSGSSSGPFSGPPSGPFSGPPSGPPPGWQPSPSPGWQASPPPSHPAEGYAQPGLPGEGYTLPGQPGMLTPPGERDRLAVQLIWEAVLLVIAGALSAVLLFTMPSQAFTNVLAQAGYVGLVASGLALSLRTATPNLAIGSISGFTGGLAAYLAIDQGWSQVAAIGAAVAGAVVVGVVTALFVALLSVPAWAATFGVAVLLQAGLIGLTQARLIAVDLGDYSPYVWFGAFAAISIAGGVLWLVPGLRRPLSATRRTGDPGAWGGPRLLLGALAGLGGSSLLAAGAGIAGLMRLKAADPNSGQFLTFMALAAVLLGGASVFGRRAGILGTVLGVLIVVLAQNLLIIHAADTWIVTMVMAGIILVGLAVSRAIESITNVVNGSG